MILTAFGGHGGQQLRDQVFLTLSARLAQKILYLLTSLPADSSRISLSQAELAEFVGASRESVSKALAGWKRDGLIDLGRGFISVRDESKLRLIAEFETI